MFYDRKVKYLDYCENGQRVRGCGVAKLQVRDKSLGLEIVVSGLGVEGNMQKPILIDVGSKSFELGTIQIEQGKGNFRLSSENMENLTGVGAYQDWNVLRIEVDEEREIRCDWGAGNVKAACLIEQSEQEKSPEGMENSREIEQEPHQIEEDCANMQTQREVNYQRVKAEPPINAPSRSSSPRPIVLEEDKWSQLWKIYPHVKPFQDEREYLSIRPADFVLFSADSYKAINNSFLLHGFYNYHHLILGQMEKNGEKIYYVGVPGNYFEREKQVAIMFGFESFECREEPAQAGDFGYYMIRAQV